MAETPNKRGGTTEVENKPVKDRPGDKLERQLEEGLEESMNGSDPVSVTQPAPKAPDRRKDDRKA